MAEDIKSPQFPESIFEGTLSNWLKKTGDAIKQDEVLAEIETDKVVIEVTAASDGVMGEIIVSEGETIESSQLIGNYTKGLLCNYQLAGNSQLFHPQKLLFPPLHHRMLLLLQLQPYQFQSQLKLHPA